MRQTYTYITKCYFVCLKVLVIVKHLIYTQGELPCHQSLFLLLNVSAMLTPNRNALILNMVFNKPSVPIV